MQRTITVKGIGSASAAPDLIRIMMTLEASGMDYEYTMLIAGKQLEKLSEALEPIGFDRKALKTVHFDVRTEYRSVKDNNGNYKRVFEGYVCSHRLKIEFDFDTKHLAQVLNAISTCLVDPELSISFTVKDPAAISAELLKNATANARAKAEILCAASNVKLGDLLTIDYNWGELDIVSHTKYNMSDDCMAPSIGCNIDIEPDDISLSDTATFIWEIK